MAIANNHDSQSNGAQLAVELAIDVRGLGKSYGRTPVLRDLDLQVPWGQTLTVLEIPAALPVFLGGLKISATLAVIGAVVGEFVSADAGLGYLITLARSRYDTALVLVAVVALALMARLLYGVVATLERRLLAWQRQGRSNWLSI